MTKKALAISGVLLAAIMAIVTVKGDAISFAKKLKGTGVKATPVAEAEKPIVLAALCADCF